MVHQDSFWDLQIKLNCRSAIANDAPCCRLGYWSSVAVSLPTAFCRTFMFLSMTSRFRNTARTLATGRRPYFVNAWNRQAAYSEFGMYSLLIEQEPSQHRRSRVCLLSLDCPASAELQHLSQFVCAKMDAACEVTIFF